MTGAIDFAECRGVYPHHRCRCGECAVCGYHKHTAIHGPYFGQPPGSKPYGHEFMPKTTETERIMDEAMVKYARALKSLATK